jgi:hypothetical protein
MHVPHAINFYGNFEILNFEFFCKKRLFQIKTALTFAYGLEKKRIIYEKLSTQNFTSERANEHARARDPSIHPSISYD